MEYSAFAKAQMTTLAKQLKTEGLCEKAFRRECKRVLEPLFKSAREQVDWFSNGRNLKGFTSHAEMVHNRDF